MENYKILVYGKYKSLCNTLKEILEYEKYEVIVIRSDNRKDTPHDELMKVKSKVDLCLIDWDLFSTEFGSKDIDVNKVLSNFVDKPVILLSGHCGVRTAVKTIKAGAVDFFPKPPDINDLLISLRENIK